ncbi:MAG: transcription-repair coupling factor, partial [Propionicimonas sp.]|nr:transcription-repair coupling factor [Propionicimonas sp.]
MAGLVELFATDPTVAVCLDAAATGLDALDVTVPEPARPLLTAALAQQRPTLLVTSTFREAEAATAALSSLLEPAEVAYYPAWETLPHERLSPRSDTVGRRLAVLRRLLGNDPLPAPTVVVAPVRALLQPQVTGLGELLPVRLVTGADYDITQVAHDLVDAAYTRVDLVERRGEFCVRGGIVDVFPPVLEHPVRIDFFGDTIEEIRPFSVADQRSMDETLPEVIASPCRELLITEAVKERARVLAMQYGDVEGTLGELFDRISQGHAVDGMEALAPVLVDGLELLIDVMPADTRILVSDPERIRGRAQELVTTSEEFLGASWAAAAEGGKEPIDLAASAYRTLAEVRSRALERGQSWWSLSPFSSGQLDEPAASRPGGDDDPVLDDGFDQAAADA